MKRGFTLLEVLIATILFTIGVIALVEAFSVGLNASSVDIENTALAVNIARANMETIRSREFAAIDTDAEVGALVSNLGFSGFTVTGDVAEGDDPMQIDVTVSWTFKSDEVSITLTTLVVDLL
jgi:prepilin-type N-terminal cleavage/methylation domain-containing protein